MCVCIYVCVCVYKCVHACMYVCMHVGVVWVFVCVHACVCIFESVTYELCVKFVSAKGYFRLHTLNVHCCHCSLLMFTVV